MQLSDVLVRVGVLVGMLMVGAGTMYFISFVFSFFASA